MGGGGAIRAVGKVAGLSSLLRGPTSFPLPEQSVSTAAQKASRTIPRISSSPVIEDGKSSVLIASENVGTQSSESVRMPHWEIDDWDFVGEEGDAFCLDSVHHQIPRVVFVGVPTLEEAKEATSDLKEALETIHHTSSTTSSLESSDIAGCAQSKTCLPGESGLVQSQTAKPVLQAFSLLRESPQAQNVVASLASDKDVWDAVMRNEKVMEFIKLQQTNVDQTDSFLDDEKFSETIDNSDDEKHDNHPLNEFMDKIKDVVGNIKNNIYRLVDSIFGVAATEQGVSADANGSATITNSIGASFMALAVLTIMVVLLKRA